MGGADDLGDRAAVPVRIAVDQDVLDGAVPDPHTGRKRVNGFAGTEPSEQILGHGPISEEGADGLSDVLGVVVAEKVELRLVGTEYRAFRRHALERYRRGIEGVGQTHGGGGISRGWS